MIFLTLISATSTYIPEASQKLAFASNLETTEPVDLQGGTYNLNLKVMDWDLMDAISNAYVYVTLDNGTDCIQISDSNGWANYTGIDGTVNVKVKYYGFWVNGTFSVTLSSDKTIEVRCNLYDVTVTVVEDQNSAYLVGANVTVFNSTSKEINKIASEITGNDGTAGFLNLPNATLTFTQYGGVSSKLVIGNTTRTVSFDGEQLSKIIASTNTLTACNDYKIIAFVGNS